jgi:hypothetical protein
LDSVRHGVEALYDPLKVIEPQLAEFSSPLLLAIAGNAAEIKVGALSTVAC